MSSFKNSSSIVLSLVVIAFMAMDRFVSSHSLPSFIKPCSRSSPHFNKCLTNTTQSVIKQFTKGIKELDVPALDPVDLNRISINLPNLNIVFDDTVLHGLSGTRINLFKLNSNSDKAVIDYTANLTMSGKYKIDGRVVLLPIQGDGDFKVYLTNMNFKQNYAFDKYKGDDGKDYWRATSYKKAYKLEKARFDFKNLYNGNKFLSETTLRFVNENWPLIMNDIAPSAVEQIINACVKATNTFFSKVPLDELMLP